MRSFPDIGEDGKRKPPPMHQMRRLREPTTIQRRRRDCTKAVSFRCAVVFELDSQVFPVTLPMSAGAWFTARSASAPYQFPAREICFAAAIGIPPFRLGVFSIPKNKACGRKLSQGEPFRRRPPGLSQPDAPCEHPDVRAGRGNLTNCLTKRRMFRSDIKPCLA